MLNPFDYSIFILVFSLATFWMARSVGAWLRKRVSNASELQK
jgi:hypothetical protein